MTRSEWLGEAEGLAIRVGSEEHVREKRGVIKRREIQLKAERTKKMPHPEPMIILFFRLKIGLIVSCISWYKKIKNRD